MKRILTILFILTILCQTVYAQISKEKLVKSVFIEDISSEEVYLDNSRQGYFLNTLLNISNDYEFKKIIDEETQNPMREYDELEYVHERYEQYYKGIKIEHADIRTHYIDNVLDWVNGEYIDVQNIDISIVLSKENAIQKAAKYVGAKQYMWEDENENNWLETVKNDPTASFYPDTELVICFNEMDIEDTLFHVAYKIDIYAKDPVQHDYVFVDVVNGEILAIVPILINMDGTAQTRYSGTHIISTESIVENGITKYRLRDNTRGKGIETYNVNKSNVGNQNMSHAINFTDNDNNWTAGEFDNNNKDNGALDAHWGAMMTYDYFKNVHGRNSYDNKGSIIKNYVHFGINYENAGWNRMYHHMIYGDGYTRFDILTPLDVIAHEIGHGVCEYSANLEYSGESGAIDESLSDIWGASVENWATTDKQTWLIGEDITLQSVALRSMNNPKLLGQPNTYFGTYWYNPNGCTPSENNDYCGVHSNSGVMNYWFYLLSVGGSGTNDNNNSYNISGIGIHKAAKIVYRAETKYMTRRTDYEKARKYTVKAAEHLYGEDSYEAQVVTNAWYAVGVGDPFTCKTKTICDKNYSSGTHTIKGCRIDICNTTVQNSATLKVNATEWVKICSGFVARDGSHVIIGIEPPAVNAPPFSPNEHYDETSFDTPAFQSFGINNTDFANNVPNFILFPNPNPGTFQLETNFPLSDIATLKVTNILGNIVYETQNLTSNTIQLSTSVSGMFFVVIHLKDGTVLTQKMMVQR